VLRYWWRLKLVDARIIVRAAVRPDDYQTTEGPRRSSSDCICSKFD
jgi:hypothetical protein